MKQTFWLQAASALVLMVRSFSTAAPLRSTESVCTVNKSRTLMSQDDLLMQVGMRQQKLAAHSSLWRATSTHVSSLGAELTCDAQENCNGTCWVAVFNDNEKPQFRMKIDAHDAVVSRQVLCTGNVWEMSDTFKVIKGLQQTRHGGFLDIGANIGSYSLTVAEWMRESVVASHPKAETRQVFAVEANPEASGLLKESINGNSLQRQVKLFQAAIVQDPATEHLCISHQNSTEINLGGAQTDLGRRHFEQCVRKVPAMTLDRLYEKEPLLRQTFAAKLDCEGCEGQALMGGRQFLSKHPPCMLFIEITERYLCEAETPLSELKAFLEEMGYSPLQSEVHGGGTCQGYFEWEQSHQLPQTFEVLKQKDFEGCLARFL